MLTGHQAGGLQKMVSLTLSGELDLKSEEVVKGEPKMSNLAN